MCAQKRIVIALFGKTCSGKSTIARTLAQLLNCQLYSASAAVRKRSEHLGIAVSEFPLVEHQTIDEMTRIVVQMTADSIVVEGSFLDGLLSDISGIYLVQLVCNTEERRKRFAQKNTHGLLDERDEEDNQLRHALHGGNPGKTHLTFDTTSETPDDVAEAIRTWIATKIGPEHG